MKRLTLKTLPLLLGVALFAFAAPAFADDAVEDETPVRQQDRDQDRIHQNDDPAGIGDRTREQDRAQDRVREDGAAEGEKARQGETHGAAVRGAVEAAQDEGCEGDCLGERLKTMNQERAQVRSGEHAAAGTQVQERERARVHAEEAAEGVPTQARERAREHAGEAGDQVRERAREQARESAEDTQDRVRERAREHSDEAAAGTMERVRERTGEGTGHAGPGGH